MSIFPKFFFTLLGSSVLAWLRDFISRVTGDGGTLSDQGHTKDVYTDTYPYGPTLIQTCDSGKAGTLYSTVVNPQALLDYYTGSAAAYSLRSLSASTTNVVKVRRDSDDAELDFTASDISNGTLTSWVNTDVQVMTNPDITSATGWDVGGHTTYNASTEAFDLVNENGLTVRQQQRAIAGLTYDITLVVDSVSLNGIRVYVGGTQSAVISSAGTYNLTITAGSSNSFLGINPNGTATCSISSFYATQTTSNGFVTTWYDQSGNTNNATQATAASQPKIVSSGSLITNNGKAAIEGDGNRRLLTSDIVLSSDLTMVAVASFDSSNADSMLFGGTSATTSSYFWRLNVSTIVIRNINENGFGNFTVSFGTQDLFFARREGTTIGLSVNGTETTKTENATQGLDFTINRIGGGFSSTYDLDGKYQEMIFWNTSQSANRTGIEANINDYYNIYP